MNRVSGKPSRIFIVDDHPLVRQGMKLLLEQEGFVVCGEGGDLDSAFTAIPLASPDVVIIDLSLGNESGLVLLRKLDSIAPRLPRLVYSMHEDPFRISQAFAAGATGYVTKRELSSTLVLAITEVLAGKKFASPRVSTILNHSSTMVSKTDSLSPQELQVFTLLGEGYSTAGIATSLAVSRKTIDSYYSRILLKLGIEGMEELRRRAVASHRSH